MIRPLSLRSPLLFHPAFSELRAVTPPPVDADAGRAFAKLYSPRAAAPVVIAPPAPAAPSWDKTFAPRPGRATAPFAATADERRRQAETLLAANKQWPPKPGEIYVLQIDQDGPSNGKDAISKFLFTYTGQLCIFRADADGKLVDLHADGPLTSASHPGQRASTDAPDCDGDGMPDVAWLRTGVYPFKSLGYTYVTRTKADATVARDTNHDGSISAAESAATRTETAKDILFHAGHSLSPTSIGCQTLPPAAFNAFQAAVGDHDFTYVLVRRPNDVSGEQAF